MFLFGFAKSDIDNVSDQQLTELRLAGQLILSSDATALEHDLKKGNLLDRQ